MRIIENLSFYLKISLLIPIQKLIIFHFINFYKSVFVAIVFADIIKAIPLVLHCIFA